MKEKFNQILRGSEESKKISTNVSWLLLEKAFRFSMGFLVSIWVTRYLGPEDYGIYNYSFAFMSIIGSFIGLGLPNILIRELIKHPQKQEELLGNSFLLMLMASLIAFLIAVTSIYCFRPTDSQTIGIVVILSLTYFFKPFDVFGLYFESKVQRKIIVPYMLGALVVSSGLKVYFVISGASLYAFAWCLVIENLITAFGAYHLFRRQPLLVKLKWKLNFQLIQDLLRDSLPLMLSVFMLIVDMKIDQVMLREMVSSSEVGLYSVAVVLMNVWFFIPLIITSSFFPKLVVMVEKDKTLFFRKFQRLYNFIAFIGYCISIFFTIFSNPIIHLLYGESFAGAGLMLSTLIWAGFFTGLGALRNAYIYAMNLTKHYLIITTFGAMLNIGLNLLLIPIYQGFGAVLATLISQFFACFLSNFIFKSLRTNGVMMIKAILFPKFL